MRTTIELPDDLYRTLKARAELQRTTLRQLVQQLIEEGLRQPDRARPSTTRWGPPPVIVRPTGIPTGALTSADLRRLEEDEDAARLGSEADGRPA